MLPFNYSNFLNNASFLTMAQQLAAQQYAWGQQQFQTDSNLTDQTVSNYLANAKTMTNAAGNDLSRYQTLFQPEENQLVADANSYAGAPRIQAAMGAAESQAGQTADKQRQAALQDLQSFGIDPSSGRYAALDNAQRAQQAASEAGAANTARAQTEQTGRNLRSEAIQVGQRYPGQVVNYMNTALQGLTGAENAELANANTGVNLMGSPTQWEGAAIQAYNARNAAQKNAPGFAGTNWPDHNQNQNQGNSPAGQPFRDTDPHAPSAVPGSQSVNSQPSGDWTPIGGSNTGGIPDPYSNAQPNGDYSDYGDTNSSTSDFGAGGDSATAVHGGAIPGSTRNSGVIGYDAGGRVSGIAGGGSPMHSLQARDQKGGAIPLDDDATSGGHIHPRMSPSGGAVTDDVPARLNADEWVVPKDVTKWKGHEFFHKLVKKAREDRHKMTQETGAKPKMKPALHAPPAFVSHYVQGAIPLGH